MHTLLMIGIRGLRHRGVQVLLFLMAYFLLADTLPLVAHQGLYTTSLFIKDLLMWFLPITVGFFIAHTISSFQQRALLFIIVLLLFEGLSNLSSVWFAFFGGHLSADHLSLATVSTANHSDLSALWRIPLTKPTWWAADKGTLLGLVLGCMGAVSKNPLLRQVIEQGKQTAEWLLTRVFSRLIPIFVLGFVARMYNMQILQQVFGEYALLLVWLLVLLAGYIVLLFAIGNGFSLSKLTRALKNLLPAGGIAFSSGCSISTMPWTIDGTSKNLRTPPFAKAIIPATTNIQQIGDCIINTFLCFIIYRHFYGQNPDFITWLQFSLIFVLARFATAAVIGGAIFIMLPIYENYLFFNAEMIAIILAFNVLLDPIVTSCNVVANGALCQIFEKVWIWIEKVSPSFIPQLAKKNDSESV